MNTELALYQHYPCIVLSCVYCIYNCVYCMFLENPFISTVVYYLGNPIEINTFKSKSNQIRLKFYKLPTDRGPTR